jgi:hypothetical protein
VAEPDFQPYRRTVEETLGGSEYFVIPRFQRPYDWDVTNLDDFWRDVVDDNKVGYFIGPMVGWRTGESSPVRSVVDGQQRLTTIALLLVALRNSFGSLGEPDLELGIQRFIERPDRDNQLRFVIQPEVRSSYINNVFYSRAGDKTASPSTDEELRMKQVVEDFDGRIEERLNGKTRPKKLALLKEMRDRLLGLRVIWVELSNEDDAYVVFETLNSRGKDLEVVDLLKNLLLNKLRSSGNQAADAPREQWNRVRSGFEESQARIDVNRFVLHWWLSHRDYVAQKKLFRAIKSKIRTKEQASGALDDLEADAPLYRAIYEPESRTWGSEEAQIPRSLTALADFRIIQPAPLLLSLLRARRDQTATLKEIIKTLQTIERFHFKFTAISQQSSSGGISVMYANYGRKLTLETDRDERHRGLRAFRQALAVRVPDQQVFENAFVDRLVLTDELSREKVLVQYVLRELLRHSNPTTKFEGGSVEHILPQSAISDEFPAELIGNIGNLVWLPEDINRKLADKTFSTKKTTLSTLEGVYDLADILAAHTWGEAEIRERAARLAKLAHDVVWKLPV